MMILGALRPQRRDGLLGTGLANKDVSLFILSGVFPPFHHPQVELLYNELYGQRPGHGW